MQVSIFVTPQTKETEPVLFCKLDSVKVSKRIDRTTWTMPDVEWSMLPGDATIEFESKEWGGSMQVKIPTVPLVEPHVTGAVLINVNGPTPSQWAKLQPKAKVTNQVGNRNVSLIMTRIPYNPAVGHDTKTGRVAAYQLTKVIVGNPYPLSELNPKLEMKEPTHRIWQYRPDALNIEEHTIHVMTSSKPHGLANYRHVANANGVDITVEQLFEAMNSQKIECPVDIERAPECMSMSVGDIIESFGTYVQVGAVGMHPISIR
jgi:hypothetical protein